ncbi:tRNA uridine-5-carboxymethylaminomethyl(34) synthesis GTPase MnmE [bacterium]|nr:tRNA uridine-5-carboxymethylaminomethyl(34) synthesis GTPase MnmE [bacterium]MBU1676589.1 tRNA uridine-5-carboxymethylaminomethyl(34) synthesis GTPase MnmE [bacterium]
MSDAFYHATADTIAAVATPEGEGGLAVVRLSGPRALEFASALLSDGRDRADLRSHRAFLGVPRCPRSRDELDETLVLPMMAPNSYTGEDTVEFYCHGGRLPARLVTEACLELGARPAGPGEFTRRAFLNGRLSLDQAEAVADLIAAESRLAAKGALRQLRGGFRRRMESLEKPLLGLLAELEGGLEFGEEDELEVTGERIAGALADALDGVDRLLSHARAGRQLREGVQVVIVGEPNAGKSSLFNALLGEPRALVDHEPGTTRDVVAARLRHRGGTFNLHDTAGLREDGGRVETMGVERARGAARSADLVLQVVDLVAGKRGSRPDPDHAVPVLVVGAKADLVPEAGLRRVAPSVIVTSARDGRGVETLKDAMHDAANAAQLEAAASLGVVLNLRHVHRLKDFRGHLEELRGVVGAGAAQEVICSLLHISLCELGEITGRVFTEKLLGEVFNRFCVGK